MSTKKASSTAAKRKIEQYNEDSDNDEDRRLNDLDKEYSAEEASTSSSSSSSSSSSTSSQITVEHKQPPTKKNVTTTIPVTSASVPKRFTADMLKAGDETFFEIPSLRERRKTKGYLTEDGVLSDVPRGVDPKEPYSNAWIDEKLVRLRLLEADPRWRFAREVSGGSGFAIEDLTDQSDVSRASAERVRLAKARLTQRSREAQDTAAEQRRIDALRQQSDAAAQRAVEITQLEDERRISKTNFAASLNKLRLKRFNIDTRDRNVEAMFDYFTRIGVARFGVQGYVYTAELVKQIVAKRHGEMLVVTADDKQPLFEEQRKRKTDIGNLMPVSSLTALLWACLIVVSLNPALQQIVRLRAVFNDKALYKQNGADQYVADLLRLSQIVFDNEQSDETGNRIFYGTNNLLLLTEISVLFWIQINRMIVNVGSDEQPIARPIDKAATAARATSSRTTRVVNDIVIEYEVSDDDLLASVGGQSVAGVDQLKLANAQKKLHTNVDHARTLQRIIEILTPMFNAVYPYLFYRRQELDRGLDEEAFAGGYYNGGRLLEAVSGGQAKAGVVSNVDSAFVSLLVASELVMKRTIEGRPIRSNDLATLINATSVEELFNNVKLVMQFDSAGDLISGYWRRVFNHYLRTLGVLYEFANFGAALAGLKLSGLFSDGELQQMSAYSKFIRGSAPPGSAAMAASSRELGSVVVPQPNTKVPTLIVSPGSTLGVSAEFLAAENAVAAIFANARPIEQPPRTFEQLPDAMKNYGTASQKYFSSLLVGDDARLGQLFGDRLTPTQQAQKNEELSQALAQQADALEKRMLQWIEQDIDQARQEIEQILYVPDASVALSPENSGVVVFTQAMTSAQNASMEDLHEFVPCIAENYTKDDLIAHDDYWVRFAGFVSARLRVTTARNPPTWQLNANETRGRIQEASSIRSMKYIAAHDASIKHVENCKCFGSSRESSSRFELSARAINTNSYLFDARHTGGL